MSKTDLNKGQRTRLMLLNEAVACFAQGGFHGTTFQMIAENCGLAQSSLFRHFSNKEDLIGQVVLYVTDQSQAAISDRIVPEDDALSRLGKYGHGILDWASKHREKAQIYLLLYYYASFDKIFLQLYQTRLQLARTRLYELLLAIGREHPTWPLSEPEARARLLHAGILGISVNFLAATSAGEPQVSLKQAKKDWNRLVTELVVGD